jgi:hypothetical protein
MSYLDTYGSTTPMAEIKRAAGTMPATRQSRLACVVFYALMQVTNDAWMIGNKE